MGTVCVLHAMCALGEGGAEAGARFPHTLFSMFPAHGRSGVFAEGRDTGILGRIRAGLSTGPLHPLYPRGRAHLGLTVLYHFGQDFDPSCVEQECLVGLAEGLQDILDRHSRVLSRTQQFVRFLLLKICFLLEIYLIEVF